MKITFAAIGSEIISIEALSAVLKAHGHSCSLAFDRGLFDDKQYFSVNFLARLFNDKKRVIKDILSFNPDILAFSVFADNFQWSLEIAKAVKEQQDVFVVLGGIHPTSVPSVCLEPDCVDAVCLGEGEYPLLELADSLERGKIDYSIENFWFKKEGVIIKNRPRPLITDLDQLPIIDKELFEPFIPIKEYYLTVTNKGCISTCSYCSQNCYANWEKANNLGPFYRQRSVDSVIAELVLMKKRYNFKRVDIKNNVLSASRKWTIEFCRRYKSEIGVPFRIMGHPKTIDYAVASALKAAGCWHVQIGVESLNSEIRKNWLNRNETNEDIYQALSGMDKADLNYSADLMVGLPGETDADIVQAIKLFASCRNLIRASIFWLKYLPAVDITAKALKDNYISQEDIVKVNHGLQP
ncbi:MAG: cobalamin-dependent protein, partial [Candidatus Omnitrophica bacterium]|nr:cobalamin-dependent protein [Candidatus Omnitrophota bacterium]